MLAFATKNNLMVLEIGIVWVIANGFELLTSPKTKSSRSYSKNC